MSKIINGRKLKVGDKIRIINAGMGSYAVNGMKATVVDSAPFEAMVRGLGSLTGGVLIRLDQPQRAGFSYWRISFNGEYELLSTRKSYLDIDVIIRGDVTKVVIGNKIGTSRCKSEEDNFNEAYGIMLAVARAYGLDEKKINNIVDALYDDVKNIEEFSTKELIEELNKRL